MTAAAAPKRLAEMTTGELNEMKEEVESRIREQIRTCGRTEEMVRFRNRVDNELAARGA